MICTWSGEVKNGKNWKEDTTSTDPTNNWQKKEFRNHILFSLRLKRLHHLSLACLLSDRGKTPSEPILTEVRCQL